MGRPEGALLEPERLSVRRWRRLGCCSLRRPMADAPYLLALALLGQVGQRAMPLQGKSLREPLGLDGDPDRKSVV